MRRVQIHIGKDTEAAHPIVLEGDRSRAVLICGKRGSGKSYTMGVMIESLFAQAEGDVVFVVADPMGIFHTMALPNDDQLNELLKWGITPRGFPVRLLVPGDPLQRYQYPEVVQELTRRGIELVSLRINPSDLSPDAWCSLFDLSINELMGIALYRAVTELSQGKPFWDLNDLQRAITRDRHAQDKTKEALQNRLSIAGTWGIFSEGSPTPITTLFVTSAINVLDLSVLDPGTHGLRNLVVDIVARQLFRQRTESRRREELGLGVGLKRVWLAMDEAHQFIPSGQASLCKEILIRWVKEGRQPGLSFMVASQQPAAIDAEVVSQCDLILAHKITSIEDISALNRLSATYMSGELKTLIRNLSRRGEAILVDDETEQVLGIEVQPRRSRHGGGEATEKKIRDSLF